MSARKPKKHQVITTRRSVVSPEQTNQPATPAAVGQSVPNAVTERFEAFVGPLPHPDHYAAYEQTLTGAADRILAQAEQQSSHRQAQEAIELRARIDARARGQWFAFIVALTSLGLGAFLATTGLSALGTIVVTFGLAELGITIYMKVRRILHPEDESASPPDPPRPPPQRPGDTR
jgi:uncharacterized membrane protein